MKILTPQMFKNDLYLAKRLDSEEYDDNGRPIVPFDKPIAFTGRNGVNYQPLTAESDIQRYGASSQEIVKAVIMNTDKAYKHFTQDSVGDLVYLFGASPNNQPKWDKEDMNFMDNDIDDSHIHILALGREGVIMEMIRNEDRGKELVFEIISTKTNNIMRTLPSGEEYQLKVGKNVIQTYDTKFQIVGEVDMIAKDLQMFKFGEPTHGYWANYEVDAVLPMINHVNVFFKKNKRTGVM